MINNPIIDKRVRQFCPKGHDTFVIGRNKSGRCKECRKLLDSGRYRYIPVEKDKRKTQLCPKGHNKDIVGRHKSGACKLCTKIRQKKWVEERKKGKGIKFYKQFCPKGHNKKVTGVEVTGHCSECYRIHLRKLYRKQRKQRLEYARNYRGVL